MLSSTLVSPTATLLLKQGIISTDNSKDDDDEDFCRDCDDEVYSDGGEMLHD